MAEECSIHMYFVFWLTENINCALNAAGPVECIRYGIDFGDRLYGYMIPLIGSLLTPVAFVIGFWDFIISWVILFLAMHLLSQRPEA